MHKKLGLILGMLAAVALLSGCVNQTTKPVMAPEAIDTEQTIQTIEEAPSDEAAIDESITVLDSALEDLDQMAEPSVNDLDSMGL